MTSDLGIFCLFLQMNQAATASLRIDTPAETVTIGRACHGGFLAILECTPHHLDFNVNIFQMYVNQTVSFRGSMGGVSGVLVMSRGYFVRVSSL